MSRFLVTGASRGIGRAIAVRLAGPGRELVVAARDREALEETRRLLEARGSAATVVPADLTDPAEVQRLAEVAGRAPLDGLINNAGNAVVKPLAAVTLQEWRDSLAVMVTAPFLLIQALLPRLGPGSSVVNVLSVASRRGFAGWSAYCAAKFAMEGLSQSVREELRPRGVRVINIYPSATDSGLWDRVAGEWPRSRMLSPEEVAEAVAYALDRPAAVLVESVELGDVSGTL
jgi:NAD(P)-dependent dehydrogenase (short-subunit alcohol dehydrogenase family)